MVILDFNLKDLNTIEELISNKFEIDSIDISLTQKIDHDPIIYKGSGTIYQDKNGILQLKLYTGIEDFNRELSLYFKHHAVGKIIEKDNYFTLNAIDISGNKWFADNIWVNGDISFHVNAQIIKTNIKEISIISKGNKTSHENMFIIIPGNYEIPCNKKEELVNGGWRLNRSVFTANQINFELKKYDDYLIVNASSERDYLTEGTGIKFLEILKIITGQIIYPVGIEYRNQAQTVIKVRSLNDSYHKNEFPSPIRHTTPNDLKPFSCLIERYLEHIDTPFSDIFGFWHKVYCSWQANIVNSSLSLGVAIEGIIKKYFKEQGSPDSEIVQQAECAKIKLKDLNIGDRIKKRLMASISSLLKNPSPKSALNQMIKDGLINQKMVDTWIKVRNKSAHPDKSELKQKSKEFQKYINQIYICFALFYRLFFIIIKYEEYYIDYSEDEWPEKKL